MAVGGVYTRGDCLYFGGCLLLGLLICVWCLFVVCCGCMVLVNTLFAGFNSVVYFTIQVLCVCILFNLVCVVL